MLRCIDDRWDPNADAPYATLEEFLEMCRNTTGCVPVLIGDSLGGYRYRYGPNIGAYHLVPVGGDTHSP